MPLTTAQESGEASGSLSSRARRRRQRRRRRSPSGCPQTVAPSEGPPLTQPTATPSDAEPQSQGGKKKRKRRSKTTKQSKKARRAGAAGNIGDQEAAAASGSHATSSTDLLSEVSSVLRWPFIPRTVKGVDSCGREILEPLGDVDPAIDDAHTKLTARYLEKKAMSCLVAKELSSIRVSATKTVRQTAKVVLGLSSRIDGELIARCSGFLVDWNAETSVGIVLTSALLIRSKSPCYDEWLGKDQYDPNAEVAVYLLDKEDTTVIAELLHYDKHYNIALFKITIDLQATLPSFNSVANYAEEVFVVGRDENRNLKIDHGTVDFKGPDGLQRHPYMFVCGMIDKDFIGGPVINLDGEVLGMVGRSNLAFVPSCIVLKCFQMWKSFNCIPRLHVGMKFSSICLLDPARIERIDRKYGVDVGLIVKQVGEGSSAEKLGVRAGDIIKSWNGELISTTIELENFSLRTCREYLDKGNVIGSNVEIPIDVFRARKKSHVSMKLMVNVSNNIEVITEGTYPVTIGDCDVVYDDVNVVSGQESACGTADNELGKSDMWPLSEHDWMDDEEVGDN